MKKILIVIGAYLPGYKAGGPVLSIANLVEYLGDEYEFSILTSCCDLNETTPYEDVPQNQWVQVGSAKVNYTSEFSMGLTLRLAEGMDIIYICGCFDGYARDVLRLHRNGKLRARVIIASMGLFSDGAFRIKYWKKKMYMVMTNMVGWYRGIEWSASTDEEADNIRKHIWGNVKTHIAKDLPRRVRLRTVPKCKEIGELNIVFLSRISRKKNLLYAVRVLCKIVDVKIHFTIIGTLEDENYWTECQELLQRLPSNISWDYKGGIESEHIIEELEQHQVFLFPTLGENYGHVIQEALSAGCAVVISDQTPWQDLAAEGVGEVISLADEDRFVEAIGRYANMRADEFQQISDKAIQYAYANSNIDEMAQKYREMFG